MHIILGLISAVSGLLWIVYRLRQVGIDITALNPFAWKRRRHWQKKVSEKSIYQLREPMEAAAFLVTGAVAIENELTREVKIHLTELFKDEFQISQKDANQLVSSSVFLLNEAKNLTTEVKAILAPTKDNFNAAQIGSLQSMLQKGVNRESNISKDQEQLILVVMSEFQAA